MYILGNKFNSQSQQVDINTKEIAILKKIVNTPAILYNANIEISTDAGVVSQSNVIETVSTINNSYILDIVGSLFKVINIVNDNIYILYVSSIKGQKGDTGASGVGITSVSSGTPVETATQTVTPIIFTKTDNTTDSVNVYANKPTAQSVQADTTRIGQNDTVVEYWVASDNNSWYRKWKSGWKECGCIITTNGDKQTIALPLAFSNNNYTVVSTVNKSTPSSSYLLSSTAYQNSNDTVLLTGWFASPSNNTEGYLNGELISIYCSGY